MTDEDRTAVGEAIDRLLTVPMSIQVPSYQQRPMTLDLYEAARAKSQRPLALLAAEALVRVVRPGDAVILTTGFVIPTWLRGETDGPIGSAALARALAVGLEATPVFVVEDFLSPIITQTCRAAGLQLDGLERAVKVPLRFASVPFPMDLDAAKGAAREMLDAIRPSAVIAIERPGWNAKGVYHPGAGIDISPMVAKLDCLI